VTSALSPEVERFLLEHVDSIAQLRWIVDKNRGARRAGRAAPGPWPPPATSGADTDERDRSASSR
jgi:hypothetical protein